MAEPTYAIRYLSLILYSGFLAIALHTMRRYFTERWQLVTASSLVLFWPDGYTYAGRVSNDLGILFVHALVLYLLILWSQEKQLRHLLWAIFASFTALMIKGSGIIAIGTTGIICLIALCQKDVRFRDMLRWPLITYCAFAVGMNFGRTLYYRVVYGMDIKWFINLDLSEIKEHLVLNTPVSYFYFDFFTFLNSPFMHDVPNGGPYFWNTFLKTLLINEWGWQSPLLASTLSALLFVIIPYILYFVFFRITTTNIRPYLPMLLMACIMIISLMGARMQVPWAWQGNGRYIYGIVVIIAIFFTKCMDVFAREKKPVPIFLGLVTTVSFCIMSIMLIWGERPTLFHRD